ncbi:MAG: DUF1573 domain-containing protein [Proteobacteria bacterium]|nr:DUF1573 domain-containing protein [Pseudomonadota bacterium]MBU0990265.1 DUF1573 domain-containing protein [Pseudomonadota bacterium]MBU1903374.1 DUF1573 domain-containing protein [Pseudomonadota bacterium]
MKRFVAYLFSLICILSFWSGSAPCQETAGPKIMMEEQTFDFKEIKEGDVLEHSFKLSNKGNQTLEIISVRPG